MQSFDLAPPPPAFISGAGVMFAKLLQALRSSTHAFVKPGGIGSAK